MTIETKYNIGDEVWFMCENKAQNGEVQKASIEVYQDFYSTHPVSFIVAPDTVEMVVKQRVSYEVSYGIKMGRITLKEGLLFPTKEELLKSL